MKQEAKEEKKHVATASRPSPRGNFATCWQVPRLRECWTQKTGVRAGRERRHRNSEIQGLWQRFGSKPGKFANKKKGRGKGKAQSGPGNEHPADWTTSRAVRGPTCVQVLGMWGVEENLSPPETSSRENLAEGLFLHEKGGLESGQEPWTSLLARKVRNSWVRGRIADLS